MPALENKRPIGGLYRLLNVIGSGSMGDVYQAEDIQTRTLVAVKHLKLDTSKNTADAIERFRREGEALRQLNHPNIVKLLATLEDDHQYYLVMEYIGGGSLADAIKQLAPLKLERTLKIGIEIADALTRTHHLKIVHRDLKPANVLLADDGTPRLTDFGIAHLGTAERVTDVGLLMGTPSYLSPEALNGSEADIASDIWAFGVILFEMLVGRRPFMGDTLSQLAASILMNPVPSLETIRPDLPIALIDLINRMLEKDGQQRISSVRLVGAELEAISRGKALPTHFYAPRFQDVSVSTLSGKPISHNLPAQVTAFVGRDAELREMINLLTTPDKRLITILGSGGMGKTRLALETAQAQLAVFRDGVFFVGLAPIHSPDGIVSAIIDATRTSLSGNLDPRQQLLNILRNKHMLLVLDNFEHLVSGAGLVAEILEAAPSIKIIATSRARLNLQGESTFLIQGMGTPTGENLENILDYSAVQLFIQSAKRILPNFTVTPESLRYVALICRQVEGLPLGIVLAASWVDTLSLVEISAEIAKNLDFLESDHQNIPTRQHNLQAVFNYSWNLLSESERKVFVKLALFQGGFTREASEKIAGATLKTLASLVNKSMLRRNADNGRYSIHELLRQYAERKLQEESLAEETRQAHAEYFADYMDERWVDIQGRRQVAGLRDIDLEFNNLRMAWLHLLHHNPTRRSFNFANAFWLFFDLRNRHKDAILLFEDAIQVLNTFPKDKEITFLIAHLRGLESYHLAGSGAVDRAESSAKEAIAILEGYQNVEALAFAWCGLSLRYGVVADSQFVGAAEKFAELAIASGHQWLVARGYLWFGLARFSKPEEAQQHFKKCLSIAQEIGDVYFVAAAYLRLGNLAMSMQAYEEAKHYAEQALPYFKEVGQPWGLYQTENLLGDVAFNMKDYPTAQYYFSQSLKRYREYAFSGELYSFILWHIEILKEQAPDATTVALLSMIFQQADAGQPILRWAERLQETLRAAVAPEVYAAGWEKGKTLRVDTVVDDLLLNKGS
jgi:predicted ATPase/tRNA A-37 threonylcarbamoyl transferase component Bud32